MNIDLTHALWRTVIDHGFAAITANPEFLFETWGGPDPQPPELVIARLYGFDDELDAEQQLPGIPTEWRLPLRQRLRLTPEPDPTHPTMRAATYRLRSAWSRQRIDADMLYSAGVYDSVAPLIDQTQFALTVTCVRYQRPTP